MTDNRPTQITVAEWHKVAKDVEAGLCEVRDFAGDLVANIIPSGKVFSVVTVDPSCAWNAHDTARFAVRWLDAMEQATPQPSPASSELAEAVRPLLKVWAGYKAWKSSVGEDFVDYVYLLPDFEDHFERLVAASLKAAGE